MKKIIFLLLIIFSITSSHIFGGALGLQLGRVTFGIGGSCNGPIIGIGPSPDNGLPIAVPFVPDGCCNSCNTCYNSCNTCYDSCDNCE